MPESEKDIQDLFASLESTFEKVEDEATVNYTELSDQELATELGKCDEWLTENTQVLKPRTQNARDVHSRRAAIVVVMHDRGLL